MSGQPGLDWPVIALSLFNAFLLLWLGFTILLESNRQSLGIWLAADGLFLGAAFFIAHSAILENGIHNTFPGINFWWQAGWWPVILSPFAWYSVILWYAGYWDDPNSSLHVRQAAWFGLVLAFTAGLLGWILLSNPLPDISLRGVPNPGFYSLAFLFPTYIILCILLALDAILRPGPTARLLGDEARRRARPWLTASTLVLLVVSLLVALALVWGVTTLENKYTESVLSPDIYLSLTVFDLIIEILITTAILLIGQAAMAYEVFTSFPLPRSGLHKRWILAVITGSILSIAIAASWIFTAWTELATLAILPVMAGALTIQNQRAAREQAVETEQLRALVSSEETYEKIFLDTEQSQSGGNFQTGFEAICTQILLTNKAVLQPVGVLANFLPARISFPTPIEPPVNFLAEMKSADPRQFLDPRPLNPIDSDGFHWAVPLQSSRGLEGWLFIGERHNGSFYTMEEIKIARAASERLMDTLTAAEVARRLVVLQRKQQMETRLLDQKARRVLHDEILPLLHTALLTDPKSLAATQITAAHQQISQLLREAPPAPPAEIASHGLFTVLRKLAQSEADLLQANLIFSMDAGVEEAGTRLSLEAVETVFYAARECLRNIQRHTHPEDGFPIEIKVSVNLNSGLKIIIENNGTAPDIHGEGKIPSSGQGLSLHNALLTVFGGGLRLEHLDNGVTRVTISLPVSSDQISVV
jgi:signal transduction histidine kinase